MPSRSLIFLSVLVLAFTPLMVSEGSSAANDDMVLLYEVYPYGSYEGISLFNYGSSAVDLREYIISDGEGTISFSRSISVPSMSRITFVKDISDTDPFSSRDSTYKIGELGIDVTGSFTIADSGDDLKLSKSDKVVDAVCYGSKTVDEGWKGDPIQVTSKKYILRTSSIDTDSAKDWDVTKFGFTDLSFNSSLSYDAIVTPFTFPESNGEPIYRAFENADDTIDISIYQLTSENLVALLCELESKTDDSHVDVRILLEGDVLGYDMSKELSMMRSITDAGGEVYLINDSKSGNSERYSYVHNKYAVIDGDSVIITSENWTRSNMSSSEANRGWGVLIESTNVASYYHNVFESDIQKTFGDVWSLSEYYPDVKAYSGSLSYTAPDSGYVTTSYSAKVTPLVSPDNTHEALEYYMSNAKTRIYSEQLDLGTSYSQLVADSPLFWLSEAANRGLDTRFILDASNDTEESTTLVNMINITTAIKAVTINGGDGFGTTHNKGMIIDDTVWVGSVNWTENSFMNNRESAVLIDSAEVSDYFLEYFMKDWGKNEHTVIEDGLTISCSLNEIYSDSVVVFSVDGPEQKYLWDIYGNDTIRESNTSKIVCKDLEPGTYTMRVSVPDSSVTATYQFEVLASEDEKNIVEDYSMYIAIAVLIIVILCSVLLSRGRNNKTKR